MLSSYCCYVATLIVATIFAHPFFMFCSGTGGRDAGWFVRRIKVVARTFVVFIRTCQQENLISYLFMF